MTFFFCSSVDFGLENWTYADVSTFFIFFCSSLDFGRKRNSFKLRSPSFQIPGRAPVTVLFVATKIAFT